MLTVVHDAEASNEMLVRVGRCSMRSCVTALGGCWRRRCRPRWPRISTFADEVDEHGRRLVVRNGYHEQREVLTAAGAVTVHAPRVNDKRVDPETGERQRFSSAILPAWARKSPQVAEVLPLLYLHGLSSSDFGPALEQFLGSGAGLSAATITRLTAQWQDEAEAFAQRDLSGTDYVYLWVDGIHLKVRLDQDKAVPAGDDRGARRRQQGTGALWPTGSASPPSRGPICCGVSPARDGRAGAGGRRRRAGVLEGAVREVFPATREQRCWFHKQRECSCRAAEVGAPRRQSGARRDLQRRGPRPCPAAIKAFETDYGAKWPKAVAKIIEYVDVLLAFYNYPAEHWVHLRTTNPIESTFATVTAAAARSPRAQDHEQPGWRWRSSSSSPHKPAGAPSTHPTSSLWSAPAPGSRRASSSNDPTNQEVISKSRDTPIHRPPILLRVKRRFVRGMSVVVRMP